MSVVFVILILFVSCGKNSGGAGGGGHVEPNPPVVETKPTISAVAPAKAWYGESAIGSVTATNATSVTASPGVVNGNTYTVNSVTGPMNVRLTAYDAKGQTAETTVTADCWSQKLSLLCKNGVWHGTTITIGGGIPTPWTTYHFTFRVDGKYVNNGSFNPGGFDTPPSDYVFNEVTSKLTFGGQEWTVQTLSETDLVLTRINEDNKLVVTSYRH
jgi:hypothetical protein